MKKSLTIENGISVRPSGAKHRSSDGVFDLDKIPMEILDKGYVRYRPYLFTINNVSPLASGRVDEGVNTKEELEKVGNEIIRLFPLSHMQFNVCTGSHNLQAAILASDNSDNVEVIESLMLKKGYFRSQPKNDEFLRDKKNRLWIDMRFEPVSPDDVTEDVHLKYNRIYHVTPEIFADNVRRNGLKVSNGNPVFNYSEDRVYFMEGDVSDDEIQAIVDTLYTNARRNRVRNLTTDYVLFIFDLDKLDDNFRFFYDINEPKGIYTKIPVPPEAIVGEKKWKAKVHSFGKYI